MLAPNLTFCGDKIVIAGIWRLWVPVFFVLVIALSVSQAAHAEEKAEPGDPLVKFLRQYVEQAGLPGGVIGIGYGGGQMRFAATGYASVNPDKGMTRDKQFYIGSLTKMMTAVVVLQLASEKRINLADPIAK